MQLLIQIVNCQINQLSNQEEDHLAEHDMAASIIIIASR